MRADRLLSILLLLQTHTQISARELAERLEVSPRTILRDMDALSASGIPVVADRGSAGGWRLLENYRTDLTGLNQTEIQTLFLTKPPRMLADLGLLQAAEQALIKLFAALPSIYRRDADFVRQRIHIDGAGWQRSKEDLRFLAPVQEAIWQEREVDLSYQRNDGTLSERRVDPLGLVAKGNTWYLIASSNGELRTYRISRIKDMVICAEPSERPPDFDLATYWEKSSREFRASLPCYPVTLRVAPELANRMRWSGRFATITRSVPESGEPNAWNIVEVQFETDWEALEFVLGFGARIDILEPAELRAKVILAAKDLLEFYEIRGVM